MKENIYIHYGNTRFDKNLFKPIKNDFFIKPNGGLWASPIDAKYGWKDWNEDSNYIKCREDNCFRFRLKDNARVCVINKLEDLALLPLNKMMAIYDFMGEREYKFLDFEQIVTLGYDAILENLSNDNRLYWALYGWDCDSLLVFNKDIVEEI